jgi:hypothetical protein
MTASTPGSSLTEQVGRSTVLPAKAEIFTEQKKIEDMPEVLEEGKAGVSVGPSRNNEQVRKNLAKGKRERRKS